MSSSVFAGQRFSVVADSSLHSPPIQCSTRMSFSLPCPKTAVSSNSASIPEEDRVMLAHEVLFSHSSAYFAQHAANGNLAPVGKDGTDTSSTATLSQITAGDGYIRH